MGGGTDFSRWEGIAIGLIEVLQKKDPKHKDTVLKSLISQWEQNKSTQNSVVLSWITLANHVKMTNISISKQTYRPTKLEAQEIFGIIVEVSL